MEKEMLKNDFERLKKHDKNAFITIYNELKIPVYTIAYRIVCSKELAEDITQEVFLRLFSSPPDAEIKNPRAWIFAIARNLSLDHLRKAENINIDDITATFEHSESDIIARLDVETALQHLSTTEREIITLHLNAGLSFKEIASITKLSLPSTYRRYKKALGKLKAIL
ncbi:MAG: RNA polymerase sigma factor [Ruminococcus sp.]|nr:RNA polymerase sigma factor [Ruminococcus sp.]